MTRSISQMTFQFIIVQSLTKRKCGKHLINYQKTTIRRKETVPKSDTDETEPKLVMFIWKGKTGKNIDLFDYN